MGSLPELRRLGSPPTGPRHSVGAAAGLQVRPASTRPPPSAVSGLIEGSGRRRESCASSVGAASVRRLVRGRGTQRRADWLRRAASVVGARALAAAALLPLLALQGAQAAWPRGSPLAAPLLAALLGTAAAVAPLAPALVHVVPPQRLLPAAYLLLAVFFALHLYPKLYILLPAYLAAGSLWTPLAFAHESLLSSLAAEPGSSAPPSTLLSANVHGPDARRTLQRRLSRASRAAKDLGLFAAALLIPLLPAGAGPELHHGVGRGGNISCTMESGGAVEPCAVDVYAPNATVYAWPEENSDSNATEEPWAGEAEEEDGWRELACGARGCPGTPGAPAARALPVGLAAACALAAAAALAGCTRGRAPAGPAPWRAALRAAADTRMRLAAPLALFIGLEQGFLHAHFMHWYVICVSGEAAMWKALAGAAVLRALVAATLSMLLAHGRRRLVTAVGLMWNGCLLLALTTWRAARADRQLPPVMAAAWAGCDAVWELLLPTLVDEPAAGGRLSLAMSLRCLGLAVAVLARSFACARWSLYALFLALPAATAPLLFAPDR